jgi:hypothetical protein
MIIKNFLEAFMLLQYNTGRERLEPDCFLWV